MQTEAVIYSALSEIFADVFMHSNIVLTPELSAKDVQGWDSFKQIEILIAAEEQFRIKFSTREIDSLRNVGDLVRIIIARAE